MLRKLEPEYTIAMKACAGIALVTVSLALVAQARKSYRSLRRAEAQVPSKDQETMAENLSGEAASQINPLTGKPSLDDSGQNSGHDEKHPV